jgi:Rrf2 family protein
LKINKKVEYALITLKFMAERKDDKLTTAREVCDKFNTPFDTVAKVMQCLNNNDILNSVKGIKGGYQLNKNLKDISYIEIENIIEGKKGENVCEAKKGLCDLYATCNIIAPVDKLNAQVTSFLSNLTLHDLLLTNGESCE